MAIDIETLTSALNSAKEEHYEKTADLIVGEDKEELAYEELVEVLKRLGKAMTPGILRNVAKIYQNNSSNIPLLKERLSNLMSAHAANNIDKNKDQSNKVADDKLSISELDDRIAAFRRKQASVIKGGSPPDPVVGEQLKALIKRKQQLEDPDYGAEFEKHTADQSNVDAGAARRWFVLPESSELDKYETVQVVVGSPMVDVLRERYAQSYNTVIKDKIYDQANLNADQKFERRKEIDRQRSFVENYKDPHSIEDRDIYVKNITSRFITDQYDVVESAVDNKSQDTKYYAFANGKIVDAYNRESKKHHISLDGKPQGAVSVAIKRRTDSGRIIDDAYDVIEFRDGRPVLYASSSNGNISIQNMEEIRRAVMQSDLDLSIPSPAVHLDSPKENVAKKETIKNKKTSPPKEEKKEEELVAPEAPTELKDQVEEKVVSQPVEESPEEKNITGASASPQVQLQQEEGAGEAGYLRSQLLATKTKETSEVTKNYLAQKLAEAEGKTIDQIRQEFGIGVHVNAPIPKQKQKPQAERKEEAKVAIPQAEKKKETIKPKLEAKESKPKKIENKALAEKPKKPEKQKPQKKVDTKKHKEEKMSPIQALEDENTKTIKLAANTIQTLHDTLGAVKALSSVVSDMQKSQSKEEVKEKKTPAEKIAKKPKKPEKKSKSDKEFLHSEEMSRIKSKISHALKDGKKSSAKKPSPLTKQSKRSR